MVSLNKTERRACNGELVLPRPYYVSLLGNRDGK